MSFFFHTSVFQQLIYPQISLLYSRPLTMALIIYLPVCGNDWQLNKSSPECAKVTFSVLRYYLKQLIMINLELLSLVLSIAIKDRDEMAQQLIDSTLLHVCIYCKWQESVASAKTQYTVLP